MCMFNVIRQVIALFERERNDLKRFIQVESKLKKRQQQQQQQQQRHKNIVRFANKSKCDFYRRRRCQ